MRLQFSVSEVTKLKSRLEEINDSMVDGKFVDEEGQELGGSQNVAELLGRCLLWSDIVLERYVVRRHSAATPLTLPPRKGVIPESFQDKYDILINIRNDLEKISITQAWSLRETDLYDFQRQLDKIDEARVDGNWLDQEGKPAELYVQRTLLYLIRRSYGYIYYLMISSEPVSEALLPIYNQLQTLKRCLIEVKNSGGVGSVRELYPYSMKVCFWRAPFCSDFLGWLLTFLSAELDRQHAGGRQVHGWQRHPRGPGERQRAVGRVFRFEL
jgi:hypothetical protein